MIRPGYPHVVTLDTGHVYRGLAFHPALYRARSYFTYDYHHPAGWGSDWRSGDVVVIDSGSPVHVPAARIVSVRQLPVRYADPPPLIWRIS